MYRNDLQQLRTDYPTFVPTGVAAELLGLSQRQLSHLVAAGREPFASIGRISDWNRIMSASTPSA